MKTTHVLTFAISILLYVQETKNLDMTCVTDKYSEKQMMEMFRVA